MNSDDERRLLLQIKGFVSLIQSYQLRLLPRECRSSITGRALPLTPPHHTLHHLTFPVFLLLWNVHSFIACLTFLTFSFLNTFLTPLINLPIPRFLTLPFPKNIFSFFFSLHTSYSFQTCLSYFFLSISFHYVQSFSYLSTTSHFIHSYFFFHFPAFLSHKKGEYWGSRAYA